MLPNVPKYNRQIEMSFSPKFKQEGDKLDISSVSCSPIVETKKSWSSTCTIVTWTVLDQNANQLSTKMLMDIGPY